MQVVKKYKFLVLLILAGTFLHFYNLNWGAPFYFHPDERNIASAVTQLNFPRQMNPYFFAYGSLPIYAIYFVGLIINFFSSCKMSLANCQLSLPQAIIISRFYSAFFSTLLIPLLFLIGKKIRDEKLGIIAAFMATASVGFIQFAHFGTFEMWLTFFTALLFWFCLQVLEDKKGRAILFLGLSFGILIATKVSSLALFPLPFATILLSKRKINKIIKGALGFIIFSAFVYLLSNPYVFFDYSSFTSSMKYESSVVLGTINVFYTGGFYNTNPVVFQFLHIFPFLIDPLLTIIFIPAFCYVLFQGFKTKNAPFLLLNSCFLILFLSEAFFFAKWTRYMVTTLPFIYLIIAVAIYDLWAKGKKVFGILNLAFGILILISIAFATSYFITAFVQPDTRLSAVAFAKNAIPANSEILSEPYDLGITPFNNSFNKIVLFNFYDLDSPVSSLSEELKTDLKTANYIILPSQRILRSRLLDKNKFPKGNTFYSNLMSAKKGYKKIYQTPCDIFCKITYLNNPIFGFEETASVFDRPTMFIFKKI